MLKRILALSLLMAAFAISISSCGGGAASSRLVGHEFAARRVSVVLAQLCNYAWCRKANWDAPQNGKSMTVLTKPFWIINALRIRIDLV